MVGSFLFPWHWFTKLESCDWEISDGTVQFGAKFMGNQEFMGPILALPVC